MDDQRQDDQLGTPFSSSVSIRDVALKTCRKQWTIETGGEKGSRISVLIARHDDDDDDEIVSNIANTCNSIQHNSFRCTQLTVPIKAT